MPLHQGRLDHTATLLSDGRVLVAGGWQYTITPEGEDQGQDLSSVEIYTFDSDPEPEAAEGGYLWTAARPMPQPRFGHEAVLLEDGRVLVFGGTRVKTFPYAEPVTSAALYDPDRDRWKLIDGPPIASPTGATLLADGRVLTVGLTSKGDPPAQSVAIFDPQDLTWHRGPNRAGGVVRPAMKLLSDGSVLIAGGTYPAEGEPSPVADSWRFDTATEQWQRTADLSEPAHGGSAVTLADGRVLLVSGVTSNVYDPATGRWITAAAPSRDRTFPTIIRLADGRVLATGASSCSSEGAATEIYDPVADRWLLVAEVPAKGQSTLTLLPDGRVMMVGGVLECGDDHGAHQALRDVEILDPASFR